MTENEISYKVIGAAIKVHTALGPGLPEPVYVDCLEYELQRSGLEVKKQIPLPVRYDHIRLENGFRADLLVQKKVILEIKSVEALHPVHQAQLLTCLKLSDCKLGLLLNFNVPKMTLGVHRLVREPGG